MIIPDLLPTINLLTAEEAADYHGVYSPCISFTSAHKNVSAAHMTIEEADEDFEVSFGVYLYFFTSHKASQLT